MFADLSPRIIGAALLIAGCSGAGFAKRGELVKRARFLAELDAALTAFRAEMSFGLVPLPEVCARIARTHPLTRPLFEPCSAAVGADEGFGTVWERSVSNPALPLKPEERFALNALGASGRFDAETASELILKIDAGRFAAGAREELGAKGKMFSLAGISCGIAAAVLLI